MNTQEQNSELKLGVLGCGNHSVKSHLVGIFDSEGVSLDAAYDPSIEAVESLSELSLAPANRFQNEEELILSPIDAVLIMSPDQFHAESLRSAIRAGKHVFVEKPLATNSEQLDTVIDALQQAKERGLVVTSCHPRRFDPPFTWLKDNLQSLREELGEIINFEFDFSYHKPWKEWKHDRGLLLDHGNHEIDLVNWYFGHTEFEAWRLVDTPLQYQVTGIREDGIQFTFRGSRQLESRVYREFVTVRFQRGLVVLDANQGKVRVEDHETGDSKLLDIPPIDYALRFQLVNDNFIAAIKGTDKNYLSLEDLYVNTAFSVQLTENERWSYRRRAL